MSTILIILYSPHQQTPEIGDLWCMWQLGQAQGRDCNFLMTGQLFFDINLTSTLAACTVLYLNPPALTPFSFFFTFMSRHPISR
jgi:hypothetical protein